MKAQRTEFDTGEIFRVHGQAYEKSHNMTGVQRKALRALASCRTSVMGGHLERCSDCGYEHPAYNSCRNNNCPKCQGIKRRQWVNARLEELLPVPYFHAVFTLPSIFNELSNSHYRKFHNVLFKTSSGTLLHFFRKLDGTPAMIGILHTWGQTMCLHPHIHFLVTGGCLSSDMKKWIKIGKSYLFDVTELSVEFKKRFLHELAKQIPSFTVPEDIRNKDWVVHCRKPFAGAETVVKYLGRYTYRSVISNRRILEFNNLSVTIDYKDYRDLDENGIPKLKKMRITALEFIRRFLQHIPPSNFRKIRFFGILAGSNRAQKLKTAQQYLRNEEELLSAVSDDFSDGLHLCPQCNKETMKVVKTLLPHGPPHIIFRNEIARGYYAAC